MGTAARLVFSSNLRRVISAFGDLMPANARAAVVDVVRKDPVMSSALDRITEVKDFLFRAKAIPLADQICTP